MPTLEEIRRQALGQGGGQQGVNQEIAKAVQSGELTDEQVAQKWEPALPELTDEQTRQRMTPLPQEQELSDEEARQRMTPSPEEVESRFTGIVERMAQNYQTSPQYKQLLDQELSQISEQIAQLTQRRNMIEMAKGQG